MNPLIMSVVSGLINKGMPKVADAVIEKGIDYVQDKMGVNLKPENEMTDDDVKSLKERAMQHEEFMTEQEMKDRAGARAMQEKAMDSDDPVVRRFIYYFAWFWSAISASYFFSVTFIELPQGGRDFANIILGFLLGTAVAAILQFFYGSSKGSQDKNALMKGAK
jgi:hypothetical protein